jgi:hypothetical protein
MDFRQINDYAKLVLEESKLSSDLAKSILSSVGRLSSINIENIFNYKSSIQVDNICDNLNILKKKSTEAFRPLISSSTTTLCHSMGNPLRVAEDVIDANDKNRILNSLLKIVTLLSYRYAAAASAAALRAECNYSEYSSVFDEQNLLSYRKEISHMSRYFRLHIGSYLAIELARQLEPFPRGYMNNHFESVIELYEAGCADYIFNFILTSDKREEKLVTPILINLERFGKVLGIHIYGDESIKLWKRWGDGYDTLMDLKGNKSNIMMEVTPFSNSVAIA